MRPHTAHRQSARTLLLAFMVAGTFAATPSLAAGLDDSARLDCQRSLAEVQWRHRIWPAANTAPRPAFADAVPDAELAAQVERTQRLSRALEVVWQRPVDAAALQAELVRIYRDSQDPARLRELAAALGDDPYRLGECLARPLLVDRLVRGYLAEEAAAEGRPVPSLFTWLEERGRALDGGMTATDPAAWSGWQLPPRPSLSPRRTATAEAQAAPIEDPGSWRHTAALPEATQGETAVWTGSEMIVWGGGGRDTGSRYDPATDTWTPTAAIGAPQPRGFHTAVWTGTEMIVWGGCGQLSNFCEISDGGRYSPATDSWRLMGPAPGVVGRRWHTAVWTGSEMIVWGGCRTGSNGNNGCGTNLSSGGRYSPASDSWTPTTTTNAPEKRKYHTAVWTGSEMIVWGGHTGIAVTNTGGRYDPVADAWTPTSTVAAPAPRAQHTAVWTGSEMVVWGGCDNSICGTFQLMYGDGGRYEPLTDSWRPVTTAAAPDPRADHTAVWSGEEMIVWGGTGQDGLPRDIGGRWSPLLDRWQPTSTVGAPYRRSDHRAVWTGSEMIVWGRLDAQGRKSGGRYSPATDSWVLTSTNDPRLPRANHVAVWTGSEMLVWGGKLGGGLAGFGDSYDPATDAWRPLSDENEPILREHGARAVWTGNEMVVWGGQLGTSTFQTGGRYDPALDRWRPTSTAGAPVGRAYHAMTWTGSRVFVWGGNTETGFTNSGGLYDPTADSWTATTLAGAPSPRAYLPAAWTGTRVAVWGGMSGTDFQDGALFDPTGNTWTPVNAAGAPSPRHFHTLLWTGTRLLVWGGSQGFLDDDTYPADGAQYDPITTLWTPISTLDAPEPRIWHADAWSGREMLIWGGCHGPASCGRGLATGGRYDPLLDRWLPTPMQSAPSARDSHTGVWTGTAFLVWGGYAETYGSHTSMGGLYTPGDGLLLLTDGFESGNEAAWEVPPQEP